MDEEAEAPRDERICPRLHSSHINGEAILQPRTSVSYSGVPIATGCRVGVSKNSRAYSPQTLIGGKRE